MSSGLIVPAIAGLAIGIGFVVLFGILPVSFQQENQIIQLNKGISGNTTRPQMIVSDDSNRIYAVWISSVENQDTSNSENFFRFYFSHSADNGTTFSQPTVIGSSTDPHDLQIAAQGDNHVYIVWNDKDVFFTKSDDGGQTFASLPITFGGSELLH